MNLQYVIASFVMIGAIVGAVFVGLAFMSTDEHYDIISGKIAFESEEEYSDFKRAMAHPEIEIEKWDVYESKLPIVADFEIRTEDNTPFAYDGERTEVDIDGNLPLAVIVPLMIILFGGAIAAMIADES